MTLVGEELQNLSLLFNQWYGNVPESVEPVSADGSARKYFRLRSGDATAIGTYNPVWKENRAFLEFARYFASKNIPVPQIFGENLAKHVYLQEDLGDTMVYQVISTIRKEKGFCQEIIDWYKKALALLPRFQAQGQHNGINFEHAFPRKRFDARSMLWDLNYFKYYFLKAANIPFDEQELEHDFQTFIGFLLRAPQEFFLYRDFQARNMMVKDGGLYFIDFQGGRQGALQYDVASLVYSASADIPEDVRRELLEYYLDVAEQVMPIDREQFMLYYPGYIFIRMMQAMGAYGYRGFYEQKQRFLHSVPFVIQNLEYLLREYSLPVGVPELERVWKGIVNSTFLREFGSPSLTLTVHVNSFSYKSGIPRDPTGHGGGFVFDCRILPNPGRMPEHYGALDGRDEAVRQFFASENHAHPVQQFLDQCEAFARQAIENYSARHFTDLTFSFGCTGGQHRSVYCAEQFAEWIRNKYPDMRIQIHHRELKV